jgi:hypothetical protein
MMYTSIINICRENHCMFRMEETSSIELYPEEFKLFALEAS